MGMEVVISTPLVRLGVSASSGVCELVFSDGTLESLGTFYDSAPDSLWVFREIPVSVEG